MKYKILYSTVSTGNDGGNTNTMGEFEDAVNSWIEAGWRPQGGICCNTYVWPKGIGQCFSQALILPQIGDIVS